MPSFQGASLIRPLSILTIFIGKLIKYAKNWLGRHILNSNTTAFYLFSIIYFQILENNPCKCEILFYF